MRWQIISASLVVVFCASKPTSHARVNRLGICKASFSSCAAAGKDSQGAPQTDRGGVVPLKRAETAFQDAISLRNKQTGKGLAQAVERFGKSARLFESAHENDKAADAYVYAGEIYSTLSQYTLARSSLHKA